MILKLGGSLITKKRARKPTINAAALRRICEEIATGQKIRAAPQDLIIIHGAGSFGHGLAARAGLHRGLKRGAELSLSELQSQQYMLNFFVCKELRKRGVPAFPIQASASTVMRAGRIAHFELTPIKKCLEAGMVPVLYGTPAFDTARGVSILSGDQIASFLAVRLRASRVICATDVNGIYDRRPKASGAKLIKKFSRRNFAAVRMSSADKYDVTGGMPGKVRELLTIGNGTAREIISGRVKGKIKKTVAGEVGLGTIIV